MTGISTEATERREANRQKDGKWGAWEAEHSDVRLDQLPDPDRKPGEELGLRAHPDADKLLTVDSDYQQWSAEARAGVLSSEAAAVMGQSRTADGVDVFERKRGDDEALPRGKYLLNKQMEPYVRSRFEDATGLETNRAGLMASKEREYLRADVEGFTEDGGVLVARTYESRDPEAKDWKDGKTPAEAWWKAQQDMAVTGRQHAYAVGMDRATGKMSITEIDRDDESIEELRGTASRFWEDTTNGRAPEPKAREAEDRLSRVSKNLEAGQEQAVRADIVAYRDADDAEKDATALKNRAETQLRDMMGANEMLVDDQGEVLLHNKPGSPTLTNLEEIDPRLAEQYAVEGAGSKRTTIDAEAFLAEDPETFREVAARHTQFQDPPPEPPQGVAPIADPADIAGGDPSMGLNKHPGADQVLPYNATSEQWHAARSDGIGASEISKAMGESPYGGPATLYDEKTEGSDFSGNRITEIGQHLEEPVRQRFEELTALKTQRRGLLASKERPHLRANVDAFTDDGGVLEIKTFGPHTDNANEWSNGSMPRAAWLQLQQGMAVSGREHGYGVGMNRETGETYAVSVARDGDTISKIQSTADAMWGSIQSGKRPEPTEADRKHVNAQNLKAPAGSAKQLDAEQSSKARKLMADRKAANAEIKEHKKVKTEAEERLISTMGATTDSLNDSGGQTLVRRTARKQVSKSSLEKSHPELAKKYAITKAGRGLDTERLEADHPEIYERARGRRATWGKV